MSFNTGPIVPVPDAGGGAGAPIVVSNVINAMWQSAQAKADAAMGAADEALFYSDQAPRMQHASVNADYEVPQKPVLPDMTGDADKAEAIFRAYYGELWDNMVDGFATFIRTYFPDPDYYRDALRWCHIAITQGGTGIRASVENQLWERERARVMTEYSSAADQAEDDWAARGFPLPPGALTGQLAKLRAVAMKTLSASSRDIAVKSFETEIENVRFAVSALLDWRKAALDAALKYINALAGAPDIAMKLATGMAQIKSELARALTALYQAEIAALEPEVRMAITNAELKQRASEANLKASVDTLQAKVQTAMSAVQMLATQAAAGINAIGARASISGGDSSSI